MPKPRAKSRPRKKTAAKKNASRAIKLQRGGMSPANPNVNTPPSWARPWMYQGRGQGGGPFAGQMPASMTNRNPQAERDRLTAQHNALRYGHALGEQLGGGGPGSRSTTPPRRPPPSIRPGYQGGGELVDPNPFPFPGAIAGGPAGWRPRRPNVPLPPGARRRRGRRRWGRDV